MEKNSKVFLSVSPGLKIEFLRQKTFLKNFIHAFKIAVKKFKKKEKKLFA
jgi:hypothetical protein